MNETQRRGIQTIAFPGGRRPIVEHVAQMRIALAAANFRPFQAEARIVAGDDIFGGNRSPETRPAGVGIEFLLRTKQRIAAANTTIDTGGVLVPIKIVERIFGGLPASSLESRVRHSASERTILPRSCVPCGSPRSEKSASVTSGPDPDCVTAGGWGERPNQKNAAAPKMAAAAMKSDQRIFSNSQEPATPV